MNNLITYNGNKATVTGKAIGSTIKKVDHIFKVAGILTRKHGVNVIKMSGSIVKKGYDNTIQASKDLKSGIKEGMNS
jgi:hypothetical protein